MATKVYIGGAVNVAQVDTHTVAVTWIAGEKITMTCGFRKVIATVGATVTTAAVATLIKESINGDVLSGDGSVDQDASTYGEFAELTATVNGSVVTVTGKAGWDFTLTITTDSAAGTITPATVTNPTGAGDIANVDNFRGGVGLADGDDLYLEGGSGAIWLNLDQSAIELNSTHFLAEWVGKCGHDLVNGENPSKRYIEYRTRSLTMGFGDCYIGQGSGLGSSRLNLDNGADAATYHVYKTGSRISSGVPPLLLSGTHASAELNVYRGDVGCGVYQDAAMTLLAIRTFHISSPTNDAKLLLGHTCTLTASATVQVWGGELLNLAAVGGSPTLDVYGGTVSTRDGTWATINVGRNFDTSLIGELLYEAPNNIGTLEIFDGGVANLNGEPTTKTVATCKMHAGSRFVDQQGVATLTTGITPVGCSFADFEVVSEIGAAWEPV